MTKDCRTSLMKLMFKLPLFTVWLLWSCTPCTHKGSSQGQQTGIAVIKSVNISYLVRMLREIEICPNTFPILPTMQVTSFSFNCQEGTHVMRPFGLAKNAEGLFTAGSSCKCKGPQLHWSPHLALLKLWFDACTKHMEQFSNNNLK